MKKLLVILLFALATCEAIEETFDDDIVLEKNVFSNINSPLIQAQKKIDIKIPEKINIGPNRKIDLNSINIKGLNGLFKGKNGVEFRKLGDVIKKGIAWMKQYKIWDEIINKLKENGKKHGNELCERYLPAEVCGPAINFAFNHLLKHDEKN